MSVGDVQQIIRDGNLITAAVVEARRAIELDPRLHAAGDDVVWVVRSLKSNSGDAADPTRAVAVSLISDETGAILDALDLKLDGTYRPAFFRPQASAQDVRDNDDHVYLYRVELHDGTLVIESQIGGSIVTGGERTQHSLPGAAAVLDAGQYLVIAWQSTYESYQPVFGTLDDECTIDIELAAGQSVRLEAAFPKTGSCASVEPTFDDSLY
jgi:hypothetical protein